MDLEGDFEQMLDDKWLKRFVWVLAGIIFSISVGAMWTSNTWNLNCFFDVGQIYDFWGVERENFFPVYEDENNADEVILKENVPIIGEFKYPWNYLVVEDAISSGEEMLWTVELRKEGAMVEQQVLHVQDGINVWQLQNNQFDQLTIYIQDADVEFKILKMQLCERAPQYDMKMLVVRSAVLFLLWGAAGVFIKKTRILGKIDWYQPVWQLQKIYCKTADICYRYTIKWSTKKRIRYRQFFFLGTIIFSNYADTAIGWSQAYGWTFLVCFLCVLGMAFVSAECAPKMLNWDMPVVWGWFYFALLAFICELLVLRTVFYVGILLLGGFGLLYFIVGNMQNGRQLIKDISGALEITFWLSTVFCIFCRPYISGYAYIGPCFNPAVYAMYLVEMLVIFSAKILRTIDEGKKKNRVIVDVLACGICCQLIKMTDSRNAVIAIGVVFVLFLWNIVKRKHIVWYKKCAVTIFGIGIMAISGNMINIALQTIPTTLGTEISFERDAYKVSTNSLENGQTVWAAEGNTSLKEKMWQVYDITDNLSSRRISFWKEYVRDMNLWGHSSDRAMVRAKKENPHNAYVGIAYRYGVVTVIPYIVMTICAVIVTVKRNALSWENYALAGMWTTILMLAMLDNVELPLRWLLWFLMNVILACVIVECSQENENDKR